MQGILKLHDMAGLALAHLERENAALKQRVADLEAELAKRDKPPDD